MRVLHVISGLSQGGAETVLYRLIAHTPDIAHEVVSLSGRERYSDPLEALGVVVHHLGGGLRALPQLRSIVRRSSADLVQCWMYRANLIGGVVAKLSGLPVVWNIRCSPDAALGRPSRLLAHISGMLAARVPDFVVNCSERSGEDHGRIGFAGAAGAVVPNGYDAACLRPDATARGAAREALGVSSDTFLLGSITRWIGYKDVPTLLRALRIAHDRGVEATCLLVGNDLTADNLALAAAVRAAGPSAAIVPLGKRDDIGDLARAMDLHLLSSTTEAFPNAIAETMLSGTPNIATDVGDAAMIVGDTGWVVPARDPVKLAEAIEQAYREFRSSPKRWDERRAAARDRIVNNFSLERMVDAYRAIWQRVAGRAVRRK
jgi:glycosyltransferase involved in cell wall biosynthesis